MDSLQKTLKILPHTPGIYIFKDRNKNVLYVGKAKNIHKRVSSYFASPKTLPEKTRQLVSMIYSIFTKKVATEFEALLLEAKYIRTFTPKYNSIAKDDKSPVYIHIDMSEQLPLVMLSRKPKTKVNNKQVYFGPFASRRIAVKILRSLRNSIPFCQQKKKNKSSCFYTHLGLCNPCPSVIEGMPDTAEKKALIQMYKKHIRQLIWILTGHSQKTLLSMQKDMLFLAKTNNFEQAAHVRNQLQALITSIHTRYDPFVFEQTDTLEHAPQQQLSNLFEILQIHFPYLSSLDRIECYDISTIQKTSSAGSMVVFIKGIGHANLYRRFRIRMRPESSDVDMLEETISRRLRHTEWPYPNLVVVDGGKPQVSRISAYFQSNNIHIPVIGLSKRFEQIVCISKGNFLIQTLPISSPALHLLQHIRDEAHRFAISYHKILRKHQFAQ